MNSFRVFLLTLSLFSVASVFGNHVGLDVLPVKSAWADQITGTDGNDNLPGTARADTIDALAGDDTVDAKGERTKSMEIEGTTNCMVESQEILLKVVQEMLSAPKEMEVMTSS